MTVQRVWFAAMGLAMIAAASNMWTKETATWQVPAVAHAAPGTTAVLDSVDRALPAQDEDRAEPRVDLNGNEIDDAVGDYRVDRRGEMYERHAPDTALLHLGAPTL